jgi:hypothetical protein
MKPKLESAWTQSSTVPALKHTNSLLVGTHGD